MDTARIVEVKYDYPKVGPTLSVGSIQESAEHIVLISKNIVGYDLCTYLVIPKRLVKEIIELNSQKEIEDK